MWSKICISKNTVYFPTSHALIHLTDKTREQLDNRKFGCEIFVYFQKAFETIIHDIYTYSKITYSNNNKCQNFWKTRQSNSIV